MSAVSMNEAAKKTVQLENAKEVRPPGGAPQEEHLPRKIFVCSPYRPISQDEKCRKDELEANIRRAKMACRILSTLGFLPLAPHLYFNQFLKDEEKQERNTGIQLGMQWLEEADELWVFGSTVSEGMAAEIKRAHELQKKVRNLPEPGRVVELLLKNISEQYHVPLDDKKTGGGSRKLQKVRKTMENKNEKSMTLEEMISEMLKDAKVVKVPLPARAEEEKEAQKQDKPMPARPLGAPLLSINIENLHLHMDERMTSYNYGSGQEPDAEADDPAEDIDFDEMLDCIHKETGLCEKVILAVLKAQADYLDDLWGDEEETREEANA